MSNLDEMWTELARYQPYADKHGFGETWKRMTTERTKEAAFTAADAAVAHATPGAALTVFDGRGGEYAANSAAWAAAWAARDAAELEEDIWSQIAIDNIREAIELEQEHTC